MIIFNDEKEFLINYDYSDYGATGITEVPYNNQLANADRESLKASESFKVTEWSGKALDEFRKERLRVGYMPDYKLDLASYVFYYFYSIGPGALGVSTFVAITGDQQEILNRFRNVFGLAYRRYADIAQAEAQAREAQIEAALERVRSKSLAMHKSSEIQEVVALVFNQLQQLGLNFEVVCIATRVENTNDLIVWVGNEQNSYSNRIFVPLMDFGPGPGRDIIDAMDNSVPFFSKVYPFEEKNRFWEHAFENSDFRHIPDARKQYILDSPRFSLSVEAIAT